MKKIGILLLIIMNTVLLSGCWDRIEINDIAIVTAVGIDKMDDGDICLSLLIPVPKMLSSVGGGAEDKTSTILVSERGKGTVDAFRKVQDKLPREIMFSHIRVIVIGERLARDGVTDVLDFFSRYRQSNLRAHVLVTKENVDEVLGGDPGIERSVSELIREEGKMGIGIQTDLKDFISMLTEEGANPVAGQLVIVPLTAKLESNEVTEKPKPKKPYATVKGAAVFHKDKLVGWINDEEIRGIFWLRDEMKRSGGTITVDIPEEKGGGKIGVRVHATKIQLQPKINDDVLTIDVYIDTQMIIDENSSRIDLGDPKSIHYAEKAIENSIKERFQIVLNKIQKQLQSDVLGLGTAVYRKYPKEWQEKYKDNWDEEFPELNVRVACKVWIPRVGFVTNSLTRKADVTPK